MENMEKLRMLAMRACFNPLNQVYVFNSDEADWIAAFIHGSFNPLNQVYVFN